MAYFTVLRRPNDEGYVVRRLINEPASPFDSPVAAQNVTNTQQIVVTLMCGTFTDVVRAKRYLQESEYCYEVNDSTAPVQEGLDLFHGTLTGLRYLPIGTRDDGEYTPNAVI